MLIVYLPKFFLALFSKNERRKENCFLAKKKQHVSPSNYNKYLLFSLVTIPFYEVESKIFPNETAFCCDTFFCGSICSIYRGTVSASVWARFCVGKAASIKRRRENSKTSNLYCVRRRIGLLGLSDLTHKLFYILHSEFLLIILLIYHCCFIWNL